MAFRSTWSPNFDCMVRAGDQGIALGNNSLSVWARFDNFSSPYEMIEINGNGYSFGSAIILNGSDVEYCQRSSTAQINKLGGLTLSANTWYHFALTYDGTTLRCYFNGAQIQTNTGLTGTRGNWFDLQVGPTLGYLSDACFYTVALTADDIMNLYRFRNPRARTGLRHFMPCFPGATQRLVDYSGNALNFSNSGTPVDATTDPPNGWGGSKPILILPQSANALTAAGSVQCTGSAQVAKVINITAAGLVQCSGAAAVAPPMAAGGSVQCTGAAQVGKTIAITASGLVQCTGAAANAKNVAITAAGEVRTLGTAAVSGNAPAGVSTAVHHWRRDRRGR